MVGLGEGDIGLGFVVTDPVGGSVEAGVAGWGYGGHGDPLMVYSTEYGVRRNYMRASFKATYMQGRFRPAGDIPLKLKIRVDRKIKDLKRALYASVG